MPMPLKRKTREEEPLVVQNHLGISLHSRAAKKHRTSLGEHWIPPSAFWDDLSTIPLTKSALYEHERRIAAQTQVDSCKHAQNCWREQTVVTTEGRRSTYCPPWLARQGGPDLTDLRGFPNPLIQDVLEASPRASQARRQSSNSQSTRETDPTIQTSTTGSEGPYDSAFEQHLIDHHVLPFGYRYPDGRKLPKPNNWKEIQDRLARPRASLSPSIFADDEHELFFQAEIDAKKDKQVCETVLSMLEGTIPDGETRCGGIKFANLETLTNGTICPGNPDVYYGARPEQIRPEVRNHLKGLIIPSTQHDLPAAPNFMVAMKGPTSLAAVASLQALHDGALGARGIHALQRYPFEEKSIFDGNAYCITSIYHDGQLKMFTSHPVSANHPDGRPDWVLSQINTWSLTGNTESFRQGASAYRNLRDWAKEQRDAAIDIANANASVAESIETTVETDSVPEAPRRSLTASVCTEQLSKDDSDSNTQTEALLSFADGADLTIVGSGDTAPGDSQVQSLKHPISQPRVPKSKRNRRGA